MTDIFSLSGKVVAITGSSRGIGAAAAQLFAEQGACVVVSSRKPEACERMAAGLRAAGHAAIGVPAHAGREADCAALVAKAVSEFGGLDVVVANAGVNPVFARLEELEPAAWNTTLQTNLTGPWLLARHALPQIAARGGGAMVAVSSINARVGVASSACYGISKAGLEQLTRQLAVEWGMRNVRVNAVAPGTTRTDMIRALTDRPGWLEQTVANNPLGRVGEAEDVAAAILFLASSGARHITGQVLTVDGGETIRRA